MLSKIADIASLIGLPITLWVLFQTTKIRQQFLTRARIPEIQQSLSEQSSTLLSAIKHKDPDTALATLSTMVAVLRNLKPKIAKIHRPAVDRAVGYVETAISLRPSSVTGLKSTYDAVLIVISTLEQLERDSDWR